MGNKTSPALLSLIGVMLIWPNALTKSVSPRLQIADTFSLSAGQVEERPHVVKRSTQSCDSSYDNYCMNNGKCMLLVDINEHHCNCEKGFSGARCSIPELVFQPGSEEQVILIIFCVGLLLVGVAGALYFCCKWYKKNKFPCQQKKQQKGQGYKGVQMV
ncbi:proepiregulin-like [Melanotaenia boesemani]|uniref:proepiregulin-like n=1 Tax=Melanotaenia boesemani TaxID=1250792 RepID=UPI001C0418F1|nr:proepiregulin-like [Melanotaenia boesemani]